MSEAAAPRRRSLFRKPDFARLWTAATVSLFGTQVTPDRDPVHRGGGPRSVARARSACSSPSTSCRSCCSRCRPASGSTASRGSGSSSSPTSAGRSCSSSIPIAYALGVLTIGQLYLVGFINGVFTVFFDVADQSYLPTVLERDELVDGNAKLQISQSAAMILGQPFGGGVIALFTAPIAIAVDALSFVASALLIFTIRRPEASQDATAGAAAVEATAAAEPPGGGVTVATEAAVAEEPAAAKPGMRTEIMSGLRYIAGNKYLRSIAPTTATANLFNNIAFATFAVFAYRELGLSPQFVGLIGGIGGAGVLIGALIASRVGERFGVGRAIVWPNVIGGIAGLLVPLAPVGGALPYLAVAFFVSSITNVVYNVNQVSLRQAITPQRFLGRMNATMRFLVWGTIPIGSLIGAGLSEVIGVRNTVWVGSLLGLLPFLFVFFSPVRSLAKIPDTDPDADADAGSDSGAVAASAA